MKKLIIICLLALTYNITYSQEPTKQETMDWIVNKFKTYPYGKGESTIKGDTYNKVTTEILNFIEFKNGKLNFEILSTEYTTMADYNGITKRIEYVIVNLNNILECDSPPQSTFFLKGGNVVMRKTITESENGKFIVNGKSYIMNNDWEYSNFFILSQPTGLANTSFYFIDLNAEPNLKERMMKAFQTLAKFNNAERPKEKF